MKWDDTTASKCRYGDIAGRIFEQADILWEDSSPEEDYQGHATILAKMPDEKYMFYEWWYGSCSGCDTWEHQGLSDDEVETEMRKTAIVFSTASALEKWFEMILKKNFDGYKSSRTPIMEIGQMSDLLSGGGTPSRLKEMVDAYYKSKGDKQ